LSISIALLLVGLFHFGFHPDRKRTAWKPSLHAKINTVKIFSGSLYYVDNEKP